MTWTGPPGDRAYRAGRMTHHVLAGTAEHIATRLGQIVAANPDMAVEGTCMAVVTPTTFYAIPGPAEYIAARLDQIRTANPGTSVEGNCTVHVMPPLSEQERQAQFNARAEGEREDYDDDE